VATCGDDVDSGVPDLALTLVAVYVVVDGLAAYGGQPELTE